MMRPEYGSIRRLVPQIGAGDVNAFQVLVDHLSLRVYRVVFVIVEDRDLAQRATTHAFVEMWRTAGTCTGAYSTTDDNSVVAWAMGIAVRHADAADAATGLRHARTRPPAGQRASVALAMHGGLTYGQVAHILGISTQVVAAHLRTSLSNCGNGYPSHAPINR